MKTITLNAEVQDGMYMDIESIEFEYNKLQFKQQVDEALKLIEDNQELISSVNINTFNNKAVYSTKFFNSTVDDKDKTEDCDSRIDTETIKVSPYGIWYRGYNKWTFDFLEIDLEPLLK